MNPAPLSERFNFDRILPRRKGYVNKFLKFRPFGQSLVTGGHLFLYRRYRSPPETSKRSTQQLCEIIERVRSGMENVRAKGRQIGRPQVSKEDIPAIFLRHCPAYKRKQLNVSELARVCHISRTTAYKYIGLLEA